MSGLLQTTPGAISEQIFNRKKELKVISEALTRPDNSGTFLLAVEGQAGIGKTSMILKALENYPHNKSFRLYGKFENHRENPLYAAFRQAFTLWSQQILLLADEEFDALKESSTSALQTNISGIIYESHLDKLNAALSVACKFTLYRVAGDPTKYYKTRLCFQSHRQPYRNRSIYTPAGEDDGKGFDTKLISMGLGLKNIYSRVKLLDGYLDIDSSINNGTVFNVSIPINP